MKIVDIRNTSSGWYLDILAHGIIPFSVPFPLEENENPEIIVRLLVEYALTDPEHIAIADPRTPEQVDRDVLCCEWQETYQSLI